MSEDRKLCPNCGHSNRAVAKTCTQCGFAFLLANDNNSNIANGGLLRKRCAQCGAMNRMGAKVCAQCGMAFGGRVLTLRQRWCPQCGAERRPNAKVCSFCGYRYKVDTEPIEPPLLLSNDLSEPIRVRSELPHTPAPISAEAPKVQASVRTPDLTSTAVPTVPTASPLVEPPVLLSNDLAEPVKVHTMTGTTPTPKPRDLSGEPAPFISKEELDRLRRMGDQNSGLFLRRRRP